MKIYILILTLIINISLFAQENIEILPNVINNDKFNSFGSTLDKFERTMVFGWRSKDSIFIMVSSKIEGVWQTPVNIYKTKTKGLLGFQLNEKGDKVFLSLSSHNSNFDIYVISKIANGLWSKPSQFDYGNINTKVSELYPLLLGDNKLIFSRSKVNIKSNSIVLSPLGIYQSIKSTNGQWSKPVKLVLQSDGFNLDEVYSPYCKFIYSGSENEIVISNLANIFVSELRNDSIIVKRKIEYNGRSIDWGLVNSSVSYSTTLTSPSKIVRITNQSSIEQFIPIQVEKETPAIPQETTVKPTGKYYGLFIGVSKYENPRLDLDRPLKDAKYLKEVLVNNYSFNESDITLLENPDRKNIIKEIFSLRSKLTSNDNLLIFFAGHGFWDKDARQGYWWPSDSDQENPSNWLSNSDLREQIRAITCGHVLLISDACFSGGIFRSRGAEKLRQGPLEYQVLYKMRSRRAITSGTLTTVPDRSVFIEYLCKYLLENNETFLPSQVLFDKIRIPIINNGLTTPQDGVIMETGDEGGDFIFIKK